METRWRGYAGGSTVGDAKRIIVKPISASDANRIVRALHYSGKVVNNSQLHFGVFLDGKCGGAMQFGPSLDKRKMLKLVAGTLWNEFIELNRMAFADWLPRNGESRAIGYAFRWMRKQYPHIKWCVSFADGTQCGDGTIYRASGFVLTGITERGEMIRLPSGEVVHRIACNTNYALVTKHGGGMMGAARLAAQLGGERLTGFQLRYIYFFDPTARDRLTVPILPFSEIDRRGAGMYKGKSRKQSCASSIDSDATGTQPVEGGASPTDALHHPSDLCAAYSGGGKGDG
jgi:hypothetical protein